MRSATTPSPVAEPPAPDAPLVSVLVTSWNSAGSIEGAIESVLAERSIPIEVIAVDDGSTDASPVVLEGIARRDPRVRVLASEANEGVSAARNHGLKAVRGTWLTILDADDRFRPGGIARLAAAAASSGCAAVVGQQVWTDGRREWLTDAYDNPDVRRPGMKSLATSPGLLYFASPHAKLFHRSTWEDLRFSGRVLGDQGWVVRAMLRARDRLLVIPETVYEWHRPAAGAATVSITSSTRASATRGLEAVTVAGDNVAAIAAEAGALLEPEAAATLLDAYVGRLLRYDLGTHLRKAIGRGDPGTGKLLDAIGRFLAATPPRSVASGDAVPSEILEPPLRGWRRLDGDARDAYRRLLATVLSIDPAALARRRTPAARLALQVAARLASADEHGAGAPWMRAATHALVAGILTLTWFSGRAWVRLRHVLPRAIRRPARLPGRAGIGC